MILAIAAVFAVGMAGTALATTVAELHYAPPVIQVDDVVTHGTVEDLTISREGEDLVFVNANGLIERDSEPGCTTPAFSEIHCPLEGLDQIVLNLRKLDDRAELQARTGAAVLTARGGGGEDSLSGAGGRQRLLGGTDDDVLKGGPGGDLIVGGPGEDRCSGGPGRDTIRGCE